MKETTKQKIVEARAANKAKFAGQTIIIDKDWRIERADELNWEIVHKGKGLGYYGRLLNAFKALPHKMLTQEARASLAATEANFLIICHKIEQALHGFKP